MPTYKPLVCQITALPSLTNFILYSARRCEATVITSHVVSWLHTSVATSSNLRMERWNYNETDLRVLATDDSVLMDGVVVSLHLQEAGIFVLSRPKASLLPILPLSGCVSYSPCLNCKAVIPFLARNRCLFSCSEPA